MRSPLHPARITHALRETSVTRVVVHEEIASTNPEAVRLGEPWTLVLAEHQQGGRGRLGRTWSETPRAGIAVSVLVPAPADHLGWVPLLTGLALHRAVAEVTGLDCAIKWPNDLLAPDGGKLAGILCERVPAGVVIGAGLNVDQSREELPVPTASSLALELGTGPGSIARDDLVVAYARALTELLAQLYAGGEPARVVMDAYRSRCATIGAGVSIQAAPGAAPVRATAEGVDQQGGLLVRDDAGRRRSLSAGDVHHVRMAQ